MIDDSIPWRDELIRVADRLEKRKTQRRWTDRTNFLIERDVMTSAYAVRKLHEARKISDHFAARKLKVTRFKLVGKVPDHWSQEFWKSFDLDNPIETEVGLIFLCNQIIHSFTWIISATEETELFDGVFVSSDRERRKFLYFIPVDLLIGLFREVGEEDIVELSMSADHNGERYITQVISAADRANGIKLAAQRPPTTPGGVTPSPPGSAPPVGIAVLCLYARTTFVRRSTSAHWETPMSNQDTRTCVGCAETLPLSKFPRDARNATGYGSRCRTCYRARQHGPTSARRDRLADLDTLGAGMSGKLCPACHTVKPRTAFNRNAAKVDGLTVHCRGCILAARDRRRRAKDAAAEARGTVAEMAADPREMAAAEARPSAS